MQPNILAEIANVMIIDSSHVGISTAASLDSSVARVHARCATAGDDDVGAALVPRDVDVGAAFGATFARYVHAGAALGEAVPFAWDVHWGCEDAVSESLARFAHPGGIEPIWLRS